MPYARVDELPDSIRDNLPEHAQEIWMAAFNDAWDRQADADDREERAHRIAWGAVKRSYEKRAGEWVQKD
jgi:cation transport regulator